MTELDLLLIRQREHEICCAELVLQRRKLMGAIPSSINSAENDIYSLLDARESHLKHLEQQGHDYLTITAEMARIRAEVRGESK